MIRTPFVRTGIPGGSSPLFRPAIYLLLTLAFYAALSAADRIWEIPHPHLFVIRLRRFTDAMLLALPVWFLHKKRWVLLWIALADLYLLSNVWYYRNYGNVMPLPSYLMVRNLDGLGPSIRSSIRLRDLWIVLPSVCFAVCYPFLSRYDSKGGGEAVPHRVVRGLPAVHRRRRRAAVPPRPQQFQPSLALFPERAHGRLPRIRTDKLLDLRNRLLAGLLG